MIIKGIIVINSYKKRNSLNKFIYSDRLELIILIIINKIDLLIWVTNKYKQTII